MGGANAPTAESNQTDIFTAELQLNNHLMVFTSTIFVMP
jgi:hypothetical protein